MPWIKHDITVLCGVELLTHALRNCSKLSADLIFGDKNAPSYMNPPSRQDLFLSVDEQGLSQWEKSSRGFI